MSSIPSSAMPHAKAHVEAPTGSSNEAVSATDRVVELARGVSTGAWLAGAAALGLVAAAAATATFRSKPQPKRRAPQRRKARA